MWNDEDLLFRGNLCEWCGIRKIYCVVKDCLVKLDFPEIFANLVISFLESNKFPLQRVLELWEHQNLSEGYSAQASSTAGIYCSYRYFALSSHYSDDYIGRTVFVKSIDKVAVAFFKVKGRYYDGMHIDGNCFVFRGSTN
eukprot:UN23744